MPAKRNFYDILGAKKLNPNLLLIVVFLLLFFSLLVFGGRHHKVVLNTLSFDINIPDTASPQHTTQQPIHTQAQYTTPRQNSQQQ